MTTTVQGLLGATVTRNFTVAAVPPPPTGATGQRAAALKKCKAKAKKPPV